MTDASTDTVAATFSPSLAVVPGVVQTAPVLTDEQKQKVAEFKKSLNLSDSMSIISFGAEAQKGVTQAADTMLAGVKNKDVGPIGDSLSHMMLQVRGLSVDGLDPNAKTGFFGKILGRVTPVAEFIQKYESVAKQIEATQDKLESDKNTLVRDMVMLDHMFNETLTYFHQLDLYIAAGKDRLAELDNTEIPAKKAAAEKSTDMMSAQELRDLVSSRDDLERKVHDLELTRQVTMLTLPQIRQIQDTDKNLVTKIQSSVINTIPLWKQQVSLAITMYNNAKATKDERMVTDTTSEMLSKNADLLRVGNAAARKEIERGIFDIDAIKHANDQMIATLQDSIEIAEQGKAVRRANEQQLLECETKLKTALRAVSGKPQLANAA